MSAAITFSCDAQRPDMKCRGRYPSRSIIYEVAWREARELGWRMEFRSGRFVHICPSQHPEEQA